MVGMVTTAARMLPSMTILGSAKTKIKWYIIAPLVVLFILFLLWKLLYIYTYFVTYSPEYLSPGPLRMCAENTTGCNNSDIIPRILHHSWKNSDIPLHWISAYNSCLDAHAGYKFVLWTDEDIDRFIKAEYSWFYQFFHNYENDIERVDAARYFILYHYGGVYVDLDVGCRMPTHEMLSKTNGYKVIIPAGYPTGLTNWFMASTKHHSLFRQVLETLKAAYGTYGTSYASIM